METRRSRPQPRHRERAELQRTQGLFLSCWSSARSEAVVPGRHAGTLVHARRRAVGAVAVAERDLAEQEVVLELLPLFAGGRPQTRERPSGAAAFDEVLMRGDHLVGEDRDVAAGWCRGSSGRAGLRRCAKGAHWRPVGGEQSSVSWVRPVPGAPWPGSRPPGASAGRALPVPGTAGR